MQSTKYENVFLENTEEEMYMRWTTDSKKANAYISASNFYTEKCSQNYSPEKITI